MTELAAQLARCRSPYAPKRLEQIIAQLGRQGFLAIRSSTAQEKPFGGTHLVKGVTSATETDKDRQSGIPANISEKPAIYDASRSPPNIEDGNLGADVFETGN